MGGCVRRWPLPDQTASVYRTHKLDTAVERCYKLTCALRSRGTVSQISCLPDLMMRLCGYSVMLIKNRSVMKVVREFRGFDQTGFDSTPRCLQCCSGLPKVFNSSPHDPRAQSQSNNIITRVQHQFIAAHRPFVGLCQSRQNEVTGQLLSPRQPCLTMHLSSFRS